MKYRLTTRKLKIKFLKTKPTEKIKYWKNNSQFYLVNKTFSYQSKYSNRCCLKTHIAASEHCSKRH